MKVVLLLLVVGAISCNADSDGGYAHSDTLTGLLKGYDKVKKPGDGAVKVGVSIYVEYTKWHKNVLSVLLYLRQTWNDPRLQKSAVSRFTANDIIGFIWKPNTFFLSALKTAVTERGLVDLQSNGDVLWSKAVEFSTPCVADAKAMYDNDGVVNCTVSFESYSLTEKDLVYNWIGQPSFSNVVDAVKSATTSETHNKYPNGVYSGLSMNLKVQTKMRKGVIEFIDEAIFEKV